MTKTRRKKLWKSPAFLAITATVVSMALLLVCIFIFMDQAGKTPNKARPIKISAPQRDIPYDPEDFVLKNGFMECISGDYATGIDVSFYQGSIDWEKVRSQGVEFVFIRVGGRGSSQGELYADPQAQSYYEGAREAGLRIGAYFFSQAISPEEAKEEAEYALSMVEGWELDLPMVYDWEYIDQDQRTADMTRDTLMACTEAFCQTVTEAGVQPMIYFNESQGRDLLDLDQLSQYPFWLAKYDGSLDLDYPVSCWQYSHTGRVDGISGDVDLNILILTDTPQ